jgi:UDP:flavonoid glycosyltransferase YjiC (YdhE family)
VPYAAITNTYWSPHAVDQTFPLPVLPWTRSCPLSLATWAFGLFAPRVISAHCAPLNRVRQRHGLPALTTDLRAVYTDADHVLCADSPSLFPLRPGTTRHWRLGPVLWSPPVPLPPWWDELPVDGELVYVTLGSSGDPGLLGGILRALATLGVTVVAATAGADLPVGLPANVRLAHYLPGVEVAKRAALVVCNGGSPTTQQAVDAGVPVLGICGNMDQFLNMRGLETAGLGRALRADRLSTAVITNCARSLLASRDRVARSAPSHREPDALSQFGAFLKSLEGAQGQVTAVERRRKRSRSWTRLKLTSAVANGM